MTKTVQEFLKSGAGRLQGCDHIDDALLDAKFLMAGLLDVEPRDLISHYSTALTDEQVVAFNRYIDERCGGKPVDRILGWREFYGRPFKLSSGTLAPRPDTEILIDAVLECVVHDGAFLDIGTGSGAIVNTLLAEQSKWTATAWDISDDALQTAHENALALGVESRVNFQKVDVLNDSMVIKACESLERLAFIVSNPPYIATDVCSELEEEVKKYDPMMALDGGKDGLIFYRQIAKLAPSLLQKDGQLFLEIGYDQADAMFDIFCDAKEVVIRQDYGGNDRVVIVQY